MFGQVDLGVWEIARILGFGLIFAGGWFRGRAKANWKAWQKATGAVKPSLDPSASPVAATMDGVTGCSLSLLLNVIALVAIAVGVILFVGGDQAASWLFG